MGRVIHFEIQCDDLDRAQQFYTATFGWKGDSWGGPIDYRLITTGPDDERGINGALGERQGDLRGYVNTIEVDDLSATEQAVVAHGGKQLRERSLVPGIGWMSLLEDTEGNPFVALQAVAASQPAHPETVDVRFEPVDAQPALAVEYEADVADISQHVSSAFQSVMEVLEHRGAAPAGMPFTLYDEPAPRPNGRWHAASGFPVSDPELARADNGGPVRALDLPEGMAAIATHYGGYESLDATYDTLREQIDARGFEPRGPMWEYYFTDPQAEPDPSRWRTDVYMLVRPRA